MGVGTRSAVRRAVPGVAAVIIVAIAGTGLWISLQVPAHGEDSSPSPSRVASASPGVSQGASASSSASTDDSATPSPEPTDSPGSSPTDVQYPDPWTAYKLRPAPTSSPMPIAGDATVATKQRTGMDKAAN